MRNHPLVFSLAALLTSATFLCAQAPPASRNLILNGNFELHGGPGIIPRGWFNTVVPNRILFDAEGGRWAVALTGFIDGPTYQNISTVPGVTYRVRFAARAPVFGTDEFEGSATRQPNGFFL